MTARIAIGKSVRFEIFKRDGFKCQYCGAAPPRVVLEVDHITAVSAGGDNDPDNLVTACFDCSRGKAARSLDVVPKSLAERAAEIREREEQLAGYNAILAAERERVEEDVWQVFAALTGEQRVTNAEFESVRRFVVQLGLPEVLDAVSIAHGRPRTRYGTWKYFCGVCWGKIRGRNGG